MTLNDLDDLGDTDKSQSTMMTTNTRLQSVTDKTYSSYHKNNLEILTRIILGCLPIRKKFGVRIDGNSKVENITWR